VASLQGTSVGVVVASIASTALLFATCFALFVHVQDLTRSFTDAQRSLVSEVQSSVEQSVKSAVAEVTQLGERQLEAIDDSGRAQREMLERTAVQLTSLRVAQDATRKVAEHNAQVAKQLNNFLRKEAGVSTVLARLQAAERRLLASLDAAVIDHRDAFSMFERRLSEQGDVWHSYYTRLTMDHDHIRSDLHEVARSAIEEIAESIVPQPGGGDAETPGVPVTTARRVAESIRSHIDSSATDVVRQFEALMQLVPRVDTAQQRFPASGGWAMTAEGLLLLSDMIQHCRPSRVVELGGGTSTIWTGAFVKRYGGSVITFEHDPRYFDKTNELIAEFDLAGVVDSRLAELEDIETPEGTRRWYAPTAFEDLVDVDMVIIDGPPKATGPQARYPALPVLRDRLSSECLIIFDDFKRHDEKEIMEGWLRQYPEFVQLHSRIDRIGLMRRRN
jgi:predicted O-methyltransferase YrrM/gas vesicle protein